MDYSKHQRSMNSDSDDFLREFFNFVQQHKDADTIQTVSTDDSVTPIDTIPNEIIATDIIPTVNKSDLSITSTSEETLVLDIAITSSDTAIFIEADPSIRPNMSKLSDFSVDASNDDVLSEPVISTVHHTLDPYIVNTKTSDINETFVPFYNETGPDDITERVSAELEKVLNDPAAFEDIELYLECSEDDTEITQEDTLKRNHFQSGNFSLHAGNSSVLSEAHLKISFPSFPNDNICSDIRRCSSCKLPFSTGPDLLNHLDISTCEVLICKECVYNTKSVKRFINHMEKRHSIFQINKLLNKFTNSYRKLQDATGTHISADKQEFISACSGVQYTSECHSEEVVADIRNDADPTTASGYNEGALSKPETRHHCSFCKYVGKSRKLLKMHQQIHDPKREQFDCHVCDFKCLQKRTFDGHMKSHEDLYIFFCSECHRQFTTVSALNRHSKTHRTERLYKCMICCNSFKIKGTLTDHMKKVHKISTLVEKEKSEFDKQHRVSESSKRAQLVQNNSTHETEDVSNTETISCADSYRKETYTEKKRRKGNGLIGDSSPIEEAVKVDTRFEDNINRKPAKDEGTQTKLDKHFLCTWPGCEKRFRDNYNLNSHYSRHIFSKRFSCPDCDFKCIQKGNLTYHQRTKHAKKKM